MKRRPDQETDEQDEAALAARDTWLAQQLGDGWRSEGDGIYRFVGETPAPPSTPPTDVSEDVADALAPITRDEQHDTEEHSAQRPRLPWRPKRR